MEKIDVSAIEIRDFAICQGWHLVKEALKDGLYVLNDPSGTYTQLVFPKDDDQSEYNEMAGIALRRLSDFHHSSLSKIREEIREVNDDVIALRYYSDNKKINSISFQEALDAIDATKQMLLSAASSVVNPVLFHPKLNRSEAQELLKQAKFRHTEEGSFILKIAIPFETNPTNLFDEMEKPFSRKAVETINRSSFSLLNAIESDAIGDLFQSQITSSAPFISYNFCDAISRLFDEERELPFQLIFNWSKASSLKLPMPPMPHKIAFPYSQKSKIEEVRAYFAPIKNDMSGNFIATVETLDGTIGDDGKRSGNVILSVLYNNEIIKARIILSSNYYAIAVEAHKTAGAYIELAGRLKQNKRSSTIDDITHFKLVSS